VVVGGKVQIAGFAFHGEFQQFIKLVHVVLLVCGMPRCNGL
jgi:hypothetical protein